MYRDTVLRRGRRAAAVLIGGLLFHIATPAAAEVKVVVSTKAIHSLVAQVMDGVGSPTLLVSGSASPHSYALKPSDARALDGAQVFFRVASAVEPFTDKVIAGLPGTVKVVTLMDAQGVQRLERRRGDSFSVAPPAVSPESAGHDAAGGEAGEEGHDHEDGHEHEHEHEHAGAYDGHVWLDPENAKAMVRLIAEILVGVAPEQAERLKANAAATVKSLDALEAEIAAGLLPVIDRPFVVFHDATQYFERRFGMTAGGAITASPEVPPSARRLSEIRAAMTQRGAVCVFAEPYFSPKVVAAVAEGTGARTGTLDPEGLMLEPGPGMYAQLLRGLEKGLTDCLAGPPSPSP